MSEAIKIVLLILISSVKFVAGPPFARYFDSDINFSYFESVAYCIAGGMLGVYVFANFSPYVFQFWKFIKKFVKSFFRKKEYFEPPTVDIDQSIEIKYNYVDPAHHHEEFSKKYPRLIKVWNKYGLAGVSFLTPVLFSIPIGAVVAAHLVTNKRKVFLFMFISIVFWSLVMNSFWRMKPDSNKQTGKLESVLKP